MKVYIIINGKEREIDIEKSEDYLKFGDKLEELDNKLYIKKENDRYER